MASSFYQNAHGRWHYHKTGEGPKGLIFIHGSSSSARIWHHLFEADFPGHTALFVDLLGYGQSEKPSEGLSLQVWLDGLRGLMEGEGLESVKLVGHSNGAIIAKEFYRHWPEKVQGLYLLDGMLKSMIPPQSLAWMINTLQRADYEAFMAQMIRSKPMNGLTSADADIIREDVMATPKAVTAAELDMVQDDGTWAELRLECPTLILHSPNPMWTDDYLQDVEEIAPGHQFHIWEDTGHFFPLQYPDRLRELIQQSL